MQTGYFSAAWNDVKSSQGWLGKMFLLGLIAFIPVFGPVVLLGYAFGWLATSHGACICPCLRESSGTRTACCIVAG